MADYFESEHTRLDQQFRRGEIQNSTGFQGMDPRMILACCLCILTSGQSINRVYDLGCGNGCFALMAAALGWDSYGIDASEYLIRQAKQHRHVLQQQGLIDSDVETEFVTGSIYTAPFHAAYEELRKGFGGDPRMLPPVDNVDAYVQLGVSLAEVDVVYAYTWNNQMPLLTRYLDAQVAENTVIALPHYRGSEGSFDDVLKLRPIDSLLPAPFFIGTKV